MKTTIKSIILIGLFISVNLTLIAQHFGIEAGGLAANIKWRNDNFSVNTIPKPGITAGITLDIPIKNTMAVNLGLNYKWGGAALTDLTDVSALRLGYINLDALFKYIFETNNKVRPFIEGGGYAAYLVDAKSVYKPKDKDLYTEDVKVGNADDDEIISWDLGLTIGGGVYIDKWKFSLGYMGSIIDLSPNPELILRNKMGYLKVAYFFNRKVE